MKENTQRQAEEIARQLELPKTEEDHYRMWEDHTSPYSAKVRAFLRYKKIPYRRMRTTFNVYMGEIVKRVGMPIIPVILTPNNEVLQDSTPITEWLEARHPQPATLPDDPRLALIHWLIEDFGDEYLARFSMRFRWGNPMNREALGHRIGRNMAYGDVNPNFKIYAESVIARQSGFDAHLGIDESTRADLDAQLLELLAILEDHFARFSYLLGDRPSIADFALYGHLWAHLFNDPYSAHIMEVNGPRVCVWLEEISELGDECGHVGRAEFGDWIDVEIEWPETLDRLLGYIAETYIPWGRATARASVGREKRCRTKIRGIETEFACHHYRAWSFEQVQRRYEALKPEAQSWCESKLKASGILPAWLEDGIQPNGLFDGLTPPVVKEGIADNRIKHIKSKRDRS